LGRVEVIDIARTFRLAAQQDINTAKYVDSLGNGSSTTTHGSPVTANAADAVFPSFSIFSGAFAFGNEGSELGAAIIVFDFDRRQASDNIVSMRQELPHQADSQR
jgi:hypothetical protein